LAGKTPKGSGQKVTLINNIGGAKAPPFNDRLLLAGIFMVCLWVWGYNAHYGHAYMMVVIAIAVLALMAGDVFVSLFGIYGACWFAYQLSAFSVGAMDAIDIIQAMDTMMLIMGGLIIYTAVRHGNTSKTTWMNGICILASILTVISLIQYFHGQPARATLGNQNFLGAFLAISTICFFRAKWWALIPLIFVGLYATHCATAFVALAVGLGWLAWGWKGVALSVIPGALYIALFKGFGSLINRAEYWTDAIYKTSNHWTTFIFGTGPGVVWQPGNMLHSEYAYLLWNFGAIGLILAFCYIFRSCRQEADRRLFASFLVILVDGISNHLMHTAPTAYLAVAVLALKDRPLEA